MKNQILEYPTVSGVPRIQKTTQGDGRAASSRVAGELPGTGLRFETSFRNRDRPEPAPRAGGKYRTMTGSDQPIRSIVGRDGAVWGAIDVEGRPITLKRVGIRWHALPRDPAPPAAGDLIIHHGGISMVTVVHGEQDAGSWRVSNNWDNSLQVIHGEANHWLVLGDRRC